MWGVKFDMICGQWPSLGSAVCQFNQLKPPFLFCPFTFYTALHRGVQEEQFGDIGGGSEPTLMSGIYCSNLSLWSEIRKAGIWVKSAIWKLASIFLSVLIQFCVKLKQCVSMIHLSMPWYLIAFSNPHFFQKGHFTLYFLEYNFVQ